MYEIVGILLRNKLEPLKYFKQTGFIEVTKTMNDLVNLPSPRVLNTHIRIKYLPNVLLDQVANHLMVKLFFKMHMLMMSFNRRY